jgi:ribosome maturation factor RimP
VVASSKQDKLKALLEPVVVALGCQLWGLELLNSGRNATLRIYIDKADGIVVEDCEKVSRQISSVLDVEDPIQSEYTLEVSSPGMDRPLYTLEQFATFAGEDVSVKLRVPYEGRRKFTGRLMGIEGNDVVMQVEEHEYLFPIETIDKANVVPRFGRDSTRG